MCVIPITVENGQVLSVLAMSSRIEKLLGGCLLGEGPHWDIESQSLYFVDINNHSIHRYVPATKTHTSAVLGKKQFQCLILQN